MLVTNRCAEASGVFRCTHAPVPGLDAIELVQMDMGIAVPGATTRVVSEDGVFFATVPRGDYEARVNGDRFLRFRVKIGAAPVRIDCRSPAEADARLIGHARIAVGGGAEGNTTVSDGGPGKHLVVAVIPMIGDQQLDRSALRFAITDMEGRFELALPAGRYYVSDLSEASETGDSPYGQNATPISGQPVELTPGETTAMELTAASAAP